MIKLSCWTGRFWNNSDSIVFFWHFACRLFVPYTPGCWLWSDAWNVLGYPVDLPNGFCGPCKIYFAHETRCFLTGPVWLWSDAWNVLGYPVDLPCGFCGPCKIYFAHETRCLSEIFDLSVFSRLGSVTESSPTFLSEVSARILLAMRNEGKMSYACEKIIQELQNMLRLL